MRYRALVKYLDDAVFICSLEGKVLDVNARSISLTQKNRATLLQSSFGDLTGCPRPLDWQKDVFAHLTHEQFVRGEYSLQVANNQTIPVSISATRLHIEGETDTVSLVVRDQSEREQMQQEIRSHGLQLQTILDNAAEAIVATDQHGLIQEWNQSATELLGYTKEEVIGRHIEILVPNNMLSSGEHQALRQRLIKGDIIRDYITERRHKDGHKLKLSVSRALIRSETGEVSGTSAIMRDISEKQRTEEMMLQAQKMESLGTMAGGIAHDFNNILGVILSFASALLLDGPDDDELKEDLRVIVQSAERGADLAGQLLTLSRPKDGIREKVDLVSIIRFVEKILRRIFDRRIELLTKVETDLPPILGERSKVEQVLLNLCLNARDSLPEGGIIRVEVSSQTLEEEAHRQGVEPGKYVCLRVSDSGCGMDRDTLSKIFDPYFTTKGRGRGTGLGLTMVYAIVKGHDGFLSVKSEPQSGSCFDVYLPVAPEKATEQHVNGLAFLEESSFGGTVLLVDDEEDFLRAGKRILGRRGYQVLTASNGQEALHVYQSRPGEIDLVLLDMVMPKLDGKGAFYQLRQFDPAAKIILLSGQTPESHLIDELISQGLWFFLKKPFAADVLLSEVRRAIED